MANGNKAGKYDDGNFKKFAKSLEGALQKHPSIKKADLLEFQRTQIESIVEQEADFRQHIIESGDPLNVYPKFIDYICNRRRNILAARPFFRERHETFTNFISGALKEKDIVELQKYHFNFPFIALAIREFGCKDDPVLFGLYESIDRLRKQVVEMNMPLAISRVDIFWSKTPKSQLAYMDLVQIASEGMLSAVDKYCLPFSSVFRSVAIGRMVGNFIENYSETMIHFYPTDRRKIYRANKVAHKHKNAEDVDYESIAEYVNSDIENPEHQTNANEIADLMAAASCLSGAEQSIHVSYDVEESSSESLGVSEERFRPDVRVEQSDTYKKMREAVKSLPLIEQKLIRLKGVEL